MTDKAISNTSREPDDVAERIETRDVAFNRHSMNDGHHVSPFDNGNVSVGTDAIEVVLVQGIDEENFKRVMSQATRATIGIDVSDPDAMRDNRDWEEMLRGGLQTALETQTVVFAVRGVSRTATHQIVRSRKASFHQQSQRASFMGEAPEVRMPESIWRNERARDAFLKANQAAREAYNVACDEDIAYQDARFILPEGTTTYILCEYSVREFLNVYAYRACFMFQWEIGHTVRQMGKLLAAEYPWLEPYIKISCQNRPCVVCAGKGKLADTDGHVTPLNCPECAGTGKLGDRCTFQGWESVEGQCPLPMAKEELRTFQPKFHKIERKKNEPTETV